MADLTKDEIVAFLLRRRFHGDAGHAVDHYAAELRALPLSQLTQMQNSARLDDLNAAQKSRELFNHTFPRPDHAFWARMDTWSADEAVSLMLDLDPHRQGEWQEPLAASPWGDQKSRLEQLIHRAMEAGVLAIKTSPAEYMHWAGEKNMDVPSSLVKAVGKYAAPYIPPTMHSIQSKTRQMEFERVNQKPFVWPSLVNDADTRSLTLRIATLQDTIKAKDKEITRLRDLLSKQPAPAKELSARERTTCLKIIIGMAIGGYAHDHMAARSDTAQEITTDVVKAGLSISDDTVRKWLKEGAELLDQEPSRD